jgi:DNA-binding transcriptional ArsR family regulator
MSNQPSTPKLLELIAARFKALSDPSRLHILHALRSGPSTVTELVHATRLGQTNVSKHLAVLRSVGLVERHRDGLFVHYAVADPRLYTLCDLMCDQLRDESFARQEVVA